MRRAACLGEWRLNVLRIVLRLILIGVGAILVPFADAAPADGEERIRAAFANTYVRRVLLANDEVDVECKGGSAVLKGQVHEEGHAFLAEETAIGIEGVERIENRIVVLRKVGSGDDDGLLSRLRTVLRLHGRLSGSDVKVEAFSGSVRLLGAVTNETQRVIAEEHSLDVRGVVGVRNELILIRPPVLGTGASLADRPDDASVAAMVRVVLQLHRSTDGVVANVRTLNGIVTIDGVAANAVEKMRVNRVCGDVHGVRGVVNLMSVAAGAGQPAGVTNLRIVGATDQK